MAGYTKGPWLAVYPGEDCFDNDIIEITTNDRCLGSIVPIARISIGYEGPVENEQHANAGLIAAAPEMYKLIADFGDAVADMFEQLTKGKWTDEQGHSVVNNNAMHILKKPMFDAIKLREKINATPGGMK